MRAGEAEERDRKIVEFCGYVESRRRAMYWYALFVKTGNEENIARLISSVWRIKNLNPFIPLYDALFKKRGEYLPEKKLCIPGYVFIESNVRGTKFYHSIIW